jgi:hypothetical protein
MYESQAKSKRWRDMDKSFGAYFKSDELYEQLYKKQFKKFYSGKPTKKYLRLMREINKTERYTASEIEQLFYKFM